jgi:hypothetical protein
MSKKKESWREKLADDKDFPQVCPIDETKSKRCFVIGYESKLASSIS